jgi:Domain of unknown function (DUF4783)
MKKYYLLCLAFVIMSSANSLSEIPSQITTALSSGNASLLAEYFNSNIELTLFDKEDIYSKTQAEMILRDFFTKNKPTQFKVLHQGGKENSKYAIGSLVCGSVSYRVTFLIKSENDKLFIHQLSIENDRME